MQLIQDPEQFLKDLEASLGDEKYTQDPAFDYEQNEVEYLENIYPDRPLISDEAESWEISQGAIGNCGTIADIAGLAACQGPYTIETNIYPLTPSRTGCYLIRIGKGIVDGWIAIDSQVPVYTKTGKPKFCRPAQSKAGFWGALFEKAAATYAGGSYTELTNNATKKIGRPKWFPCSSEKKSSFDDVLSAIADGGYAVFAFPQQYDESGEKVKIPGLVTGHAFALVDAAVVSDAEGNPHNLIRIENPWGGGSDFPSLYSDDSSFWETCDHPELAEDSGATGGNWWMSWDELLTVKQTDGIKFILPLPRPQYPHLDEIFVDFIGDGTMTKWPTFEQLKEKGAEVMLILEENSTVRINLSWEIRTGSCHSFAHILEENGTLHKMQYGWWGRELSKVFNLPPGRHLIYPGTVGINSDQGTMRIFVQSSHPMAMDQSSRQK